MRGDGGVPVLGAAVPNNTPGGSSNIEDLLLLKNDALFIRNSNLTGRLVFYLHPYFLDHPPLSTSLLYYFM